MAVARRRPYRSPRICRSLQPSRTPPPGRSRDGRDAGQFAVAKQSQTSGLRDFHLRPNRAKCVGMGQAPNRRDRPEGIVPRHQRRCAGRAGAACNCKPSYQAQVWSPRDGKPIRKTFKTIADARAWRAEAKVALSGGTMRAPTRTTLAEAAEPWLAAAKAEVIRTRSGEPYKPSALRAYEQVLRARVLPKLGHMRLSSVTRNTIQDLVDELVAEGLAPSTIRNSVLPLRAIYRRALARSEVLVNPTLGLSLPVARGRRERIARPAEAHALIEALGPRSGALGDGALRGLAPGRATGASVGRRRLQSTVVVVTLVHARGRDSGVPVIAHGASVWMVRSGKVVQARLHQSKGDALETLGPSEQDVHADS